MKCCIVILLLLVVGCGKSEKESAPVSKTVPTMAETLTKLYPEDYPEESAEKLAAKQAAEKPAGANPFENEPVMPSKETHQSLGEFAESATEDDHDLPSPAEKPAAPRKILSRFIATGSSIFKYVMILLAVLLLGVVFYKSPKAGFSLIVMGFCMYVFGLMGYYVLDLMGYAGVDASEWTWTQIAQVTFAAGMICIASCFTWVALLAILLDELLGEKIGITIIISLMMLGFVLCLISVPVLLWNALTFTV